jgi:hypothetical protein
MVLERKGEREEKVRSGPPVLGNLIVAIMCCE